MKRLLVAIALLLPFALFAPHALADDAGTGSGLSIGSGSAGTGSGSAVAPAAPTVPAFNVDPDHPADTAETAWSEVKQFGVLWGGMIVLYGVGTFIIKRNDESHWLSQDHTLPIAVGLLGTLAAILNAKFAGGSWPAVLSTLMATVTLILQKPKPGPTVPA